MYEGIALQTTMFWRLFETTKDILEEQGGYFRPVVHFFWQDGRSSTIDMSDNDMDNLKVAQFLKDMDNFCVEQDVHVAYVCFPLPAQKRYACVLVSKDFGGGGIIRGIHLKGGVAIESTHDLTKYGEIFKEFRFHASFHDLAGIGRA